MKSFTLPALLLLSVTVHAQEPPHTLAAMRGHYRPLLIFSGEQTRLAEQQFTAASDYAADCRERDVIIVGVVGSKPTVQSVLLSPEDDRAARKSFGVSPGEFTVILLGKDGGEKLRSHKPIPWETLRTTIDAMPMRKGETRQR